MLRIFSTDRLSAMLPSRSDRPPKSSNDRCLCRSVGSVTCATMMPKTMLLIARRPCARHAMTSTVSPTIGVPLYSFADRSDMLMLRGHSISRARDAQSRTGAANAVANAGHPQPARYCQAFGVALRLNHSLRSCLHSPKWELPRSAPLLKDSRAPYVMAFAVYSSPAGSRNGTKP